MRTRGKVLSLLLVAIMIISSFGFVVMADAEIVSQGAVVDYNNAPEYDYIYYSDESLNIVCHKQFIHLEKLDSNILFNVKTVVFDINEFAGYSSRFYIFGENCKAEEIYFVGYDNVLIKELCLEQFTTLERIVLPEVDSIGYVYFYNLGISTLEFIKDSNISSLSIDACEELSEAFVPSTVNSVKISECNNLTKIVLPDTLQNIQIKDCRKLTELTVPKTSRGVFRSGSLEKVTLSSGIEMITGGMFSGCTALSLVEVPNSVTSVQYSAFRNCSSLKSITLPSSVRDIDNYAFAESGLESFTFPSSLINIQYKVFYNCENLKSITIPTSVECIDATAFAGCTALKDVYYQGTEAQWNQIMFDPEDVSVSKIFNNATIHFNVKSGWSKSGDTWYYYDETGSLAKGWKQIKGEWYYFDTAGKMLTGWQKINNNWYYIGDDGVMASGWNQINGKWYFLGSGGAMKTGWYYTGSSWVYLNDDGDMAIGWKLINSKWYYFDTYGEMTTGWKSIGGKWYYFTDNGDMKTGWVEDDGDWYYMKSDGSMARSEYCGGYWLNSAGIWSYKYKANWYKNDNGWWYGDDSGWYAKNETLIIDGVSYDFDSNGYMK